MLRILILAGILFSMETAPVYAGSAPAYITQYVDNAAPVGKGRMNYMFWELYDATLYAPNGEFSRTKPFALSLRYLRTIDGRDIADTSAEEIRRQGRADEIKIAMWHEQMRRIFPDVTAETVLTGLCLPGKETRFFLNGKFIGAIQDDEFSRQFFDIWLGPKTRAPGLRSALVGA